MRTMFLVLWFLVLALPGAAQELKLPFGLLWSDNLTQATAKLAAQGGKTNGPREDAVSFFGLKIGDVPVDMADVSCDQRGIFLVKISADAKTPGAKEILPALKLKYGEPHDKQFTSWSFGTPPLSLSVIQNDLIIVIYQDVERLKAVADGYRAEREKKRAGIAKEL